jgi:uncharacterized repeat protein (TIGR01451 family)
MFRPTRSQVLALCGAASMLIISIAATADGLSRWPAGFAAKTAERPRGQDIAHASVNTAESSCTPIPDAAYNGQLDSMLCRSVQGLDQGIQSLRLKLGVNHSFAGDLTVKVVSPAGQVATVLSRPGLAETADDGSSSCCGDSSGLSAAAPISFDDSASDSAEAMGAALGDSAVVCRDDQHCTFRPDAGAAPPGTLSDFAGTNGAGNWQVCVGDGGSLETGSLCSASLIINNQDADLAIDADFPNGTDTQQAFTLRLDVSNHGPVAQSNVSVTDMLPSSLTYVGSDCGVNANGSLMTWNIGAMAVNDHRVCNVSVRNAQSDTCAQIATTASVRGDIADSNPGNNSSTAQNGGDNLVSDPSLETSGPNHGGVWDSSSTNFGAVFCAQGRCTDNPTETAYSGDWWAWFGGIDPTNTGGATFPETGMLSQSLLVPPEVDQLYFQLRMPECSGSAADYIALRIDGTELWRADASNAALCGSASYSQQAVNISAYADGATHAIEFVGVQTGLGGVSTFFVDNVAFMAPLVCSASAPNEVIFAANFESD